MRVTPTDKRLTVDGNVAVKYGRDVSSNRHYAVWFRDRTRDYDNRTWAMEKRVYDKICDVDGVLIVCDGTLYAADIDAFEDFTTEVDGDQHYMLWDHHARRIGAPADHLRDTLYYE